MRRKWLFLAPAIIIPILTLGIAFLSGRQFVVAASLWVQPSQILSEEGRSSLRRAPNLTEAQVIKDRLATDDFRGKIMDRSGLTELILSENWPEPTRTQELFASNGMLNIVGKVLGIAAPQSQTAKANYAITLIGKSMKVGVVGDNVVVIRYEGSDPDLGQRLIEEAIDVHKEERIAVQVREAETGVEFLSRQLQSQEQRLSVSTEALLRFEEEFPAPQSPQLA